jgi:hypothetical protein
MATNDSTIKHGNITHGHTWEGGFTKTYGSWVSMMRRCHWENQNEKYKVYWGAGITVCERWHDFRNFLEDMGDRPDGTSIDRIDGTKGYCKENCRWATPKQQGRNLKSNVLITKDGVTDCVAAWAERTGISPYTIHSRIKRGYPEEFWLLKSVPRYWKKSARKPLSN